MYKVSKYMRQCMNENCLRWKQNEFETSQENLESLITL